MQHSQIRVPLNLSLQEVQVVVAALDEMPHKLVRDLIPRLQGQAEAAVHVAHGAQGDTEGAQLREEFDSDEIPGDAPEVGIGG